MDRNFQRALPLVLRHEGGYVNHPSDPGGHTNKGVTLATFRRYVKPNGTVEDLKRITDEQVAAVYYRHYWSAVQAHQLPSGLDYAVFDFAVNSGPDRAAKYLQALVGATADGKVGPATIRAVEAHDPAKLINGLCDARMAFLKRLSTWGTFGKGWTRRVEDVRRHALEWVGKPADIEKVVPVEVEEKVQKRTGLWGWITTALGGGGAGVAGMFGLDWQTIAALGAVAVVGILIVVLLGPQLARQVRRIRDELRAA